MATTLKSTSQLPNRPHGRQELRRDRITAAVVLAIIFVLMALMIWLGLTIAAPNLDWSLFVPAAAFGLLSLLG